MEQRPRLFNDLKIALATLYSLPLPNGASRISNHDAHEYLMHLQSRNVRRKIQAVQQSRRDQLAGNQTSQTPLQQHVINHSKVEMGSSWLACLFTLVSAQMPTEQLFCAQTLLHRLRRSRLLEAIDWEAEHPRDYDENEVLQVFHSIDVAHIAEQYKSILRYLHPFLGAVLDSVPVASTATPNDEERLKGELSLLTLAGILYLLLAHYPALNNGSGELFQRMPPIATTLGAAIATIALRLRHSGTTMAQQEAPTILATITHALSVVWETSSRFNDNGSSGPTLSNSSAFALALHACLGSIPDTVMGDMQSSGARGRLSMDPVSLQAAMNELRQTGVSQMWTTLRQLDEQGVNAFNDQLLLESCTMWARFLPLPTDFLEYLCPIVNKHLSDSPGANQQLALKLAVAVLEAGTWTVEEVLAHSLGLSEQQQIQQMGKKKQSNKSKKRHNAKIESSATSSLVEQAESEVRLRGAAACHLTILTWDMARPLLSRQIQNMSANPHAQVSGEGPIGYLVTAANACLPHVVRNESMPHGRDLFAAIIAPFQELCRSTNKSVRALVMEALYSLHKSVATGEPVDAAFEAVIVDHFFTCAMGVASACCYPTDYFDNLGAVNDEELEVERNDVRDLIRTLSGSKGDVSATLCQAENISTQVLIQLVGACKEAVASAQMNQQISPEPAVHTFSALAKPLNQSIKWILGDVTSRTTQLSLAALETATMLCNNILAAFERSPSVPSILPSCRTANIAIASLSPFLAAFSRPFHATDERPQMVKALTLAVVKMTALSIENLPELAAQSSLGRHIYDIRGAMRGPGGEDHVGCLALMRIVNETDDLTKVVIQSSSGLVPCLCHLHAALRKIEVERGPGNWHGRGVTPTSRRILLSVLCRLEMVSEGVTASNMLQDLFSATVRTIASFRAVQLDENVFYEMSEAVHDIVAFPGILSRSLMEASLTTMDDRSDSMEALTRACLEGYRSVLIRSNPDEAALQWNRLRAALFYLLTNTSTGDMPLRVAQMAQAFVEAECEAVSRQCTAGPLSHSLIFCDELVSQDVVPAGVFIRVFSEILRSQQTVSTAKRINSALRTLSGVLDQSQADESSMFPNVIQAMYGCKDSVFESVLHSCPEPVGGAFVDPRPTLLEAWLMAVVDMMQSTIPESLVSFAKTLVTETFVAATSLLFYPTLRRLEDGVEDPGMSFDGPQSLALMTFFSRTLALPLGANILEAAATALSQQLPLDLGEVVASFGLNPRVGSIAIIAAAFFRAAQGGLPPWAVESIPEVYSAFYYALGRDTVGFGSVLRVAMDLRMTKYSSVRFGGLQPGKLLSGHYFESLSSQAKDKFVQDAVNLARQDDLASWRRLKVLIKAACGGKKKDSGFQLKPALTKWDFDRI